MNLPRTLAHAIAQEASMDWLLEQDPLLPVLPGSARLQVYRMVADLSLKSGACITRNPEQLALLAGRLPERVHALLSQALQANSKSH